MIRTLCLWVAIFFMIPTGTFEHFHIYPVTEKRPSITEQCIGDAMAVKHEIRRICEFYTEKVPSKITVLLLQCELDDYTNNTMDNFTVYYVKSFVLIKNNEIWVKSIIVPIKGADPIKFTFRLVTEC